MKSNPEVVTQLLELLERYTSQPIVGEVENFNFVTCASLDSFALLCFVTDIEERFLIAFAPEELICESIQTLGGMASAVVKKQTRVV